MSFTLLAVLFLLFISLFAMIGFMVARRQSPQAPTPDSEKCAICRESFLKTKLIERQVGDYKLLYFCKACVEGLNKDLAKLS